MLKEQLDGNKASWVDKEENCEVFVTNFGNAHISRDTYEATYGVIGLGRNQGNTRINVKIIDGEFQVYRDYLGSRMVEELHSPNFPYKPMGSTKDFPVSDILKILKNDDNYSIAAIAMKKELIRLMRAKLYFSRTDLKMLKELFKLWRKTIYVKRTPIVTK